jgi:glucose-1-phosphate adenylyltransferase
VGKEDGLYAAGAVVIRDGVLVVPKGAVLAPNTVGGDRRFNRERP